MLKMKPLLKKSKLFVRKRLKKPETYKMYNLQHPLVIYFYQYQ